MHRKSNSQDECNSRRGVVCIYVTISYLGGFSRSLLNTLIKALIGDRLDNANAVSGLINIYFIL